MFLNYILIIVTSPPFPQSHNAYYNSIILRWKDPISNTNPIQKYLVSKGKICPTLDSNYDFEHDKTTANVTQSYEQIFDGLKSKTTYNFTIVAISYTESNQPIYSKCLNITISTPAGPPDSVSTIICKPTSYSIYLEWNEPYNGGSKILYYEIKYKENSEYVNEVKEVPIFYPFNSTNLRDNIIVPYTEYYIQIVVYNDYGGSEVNSTICRTLPTGIYISLSNYSLFLYLILIVIDTIIYSIFSLHIYLFIYLFV